MRFPASASTLARGALWLVGGLAPAAHRVRRLVSGTVVAGVVCQGGSAGAEAPASADAPADARGPEDRRALPDYDGRPERTTVGDALLWVPRVVLFPAYLVSEYVLRRPIGWLLATAEREHWPTILIDFFTFADRKIGIVPTGIIDIGLRPSFGIYAFWNDFAVEGNDLRLRATYGGAGFWQVRLADRYELGPGHLVTAVGFEQRPDNVFHGIGRQTLDARSRYKSRNTHAELSYRAPWVRSSYARVLATVREVELDGDTGCCEDPSVNEQIGRGVFAAPPGMNQVYDYASQSVEVVLDNRWPRFPDLERGSDYVVPPGTGVRLALRGGLFELLSQSLAVRDVLAPTWLRYGASLGIHYDLTGHQRSVSATAAVDFADPLGSGAVPLTELVTLGGERPLRGFLANELSDRSSAVLRLEYRWPVAVWADGNLLYEVGNVFGAGLTGFELSELRSSYGVGFSTIGVQDHPLHVLVAAGTESFADGADLDSLRLVIGTTAGF